MGISSSRTRFANAELPRSIRRGPITSTTTTATDPRRLGAMANAFLESCVRGLREADKDRAAVVRALADWRNIAEAAARHGIDPRIVAGIGVRETGYRNVRQPDGMGRGVFQIDLRANPNVTRAQAMDVAWAADWAAARIAENLRYVRREYPRFTEAQAMQAALAAYNFHTDDISGNPDTIDVGTPGHNYGRNVRDIATCF